MKILALIAATLAFAAAMAVGDPMLEQSVAPKTLVEILSGMDWKNQVAWLLFWISPLLLAANVNMFWVTFWRWGKIEEGVRPTRNQVRAYALKAGALWGLLFQVTLQRPIAFILGVPVFWEVCLLAGAVTGVFSMIAWWLWVLGAKKFKVDKLYVWLDVKKEANGGPAEDGDLTIMERQARGTEKKE